MLPKSRVTYSLNNKWVAFGLKAILLLKSNSFSSLDQNKKQLEKGIILLPTFPSLPISFHILHWPTSLLNDRTLSREIRLIRIGWGESFTLTNKHIEAFIWASAVNIRYSQWKDRFVVNTPSSIILSSSNCGFGAKLWHFFVTVIRILVFRTRKLWYVHVYFYCSFLTLLHC